MIFLSLSISSAIGKSTVSLLILLIIWFSFIIIPDFKFFLSERLFSLSSQYQQTREFNIVYEQNMIGAMKKINNNIENGVLYMTS